MGKQPADETRMHGSEEAAALATFGRRRAVPRACIADAKQHIRRFLGEALEELGFVTCECVEAGELGAVLDREHPAVVVIGLSAGGIEAGEILKALAAKGFDAHVLLLGSRGLAVVEALQELGGELGLAMMPVLETPYRDGELRERVAMLLPAEAPTTSPVDVAEALHAGWLDLWYQPKIDVRTLTLRGAEALIRMRHPHWGILSPAYFIPDDGDPHSCALSEFVIGRAVADWRLFVAEYTSIEIAINLPIAFLQDPESIRYLCRQLPDHPAFEGLIIEINGTEIIRDLALAKNIAKELRFHNIGVSIDDLGAEWPTLIGVHDFPFVELKVDQKFVAGCADDRLKRTVCRRILELADGFGVRTVAEGIETRADFIAAHAMGFDLIQGFLLAKPMPAKKFAQTMLRHPVTVPQ
jgi:EAL domain-containing protein (putative c-di-GMP-specific phosphodiesterase class I)/CheY-like chemotaxis protein